MRVSFSLIALASLGMVAAAAVPNIAYRAFVTPVDDGGNDGPTKSHDSQPPGFPTWPYSNSINVPTHIPSHSWGSPGGSPTAVRSHLPSGEHSHPWGSASGFRSLGRPTPSASGPFPHSHSHVSHSGGAQPTDGHSRLPHTHSGSGFSSVHRPTQSTGNGGHAHDRHSAGGGPHKSTFPTGFSGYPTPTGEVA